MRSAHQRSWRTATDVTEESTEAGCPSIMCAGPPLRLVWDSGSQCDGHRRSTGMATNTHPFEARP